MKFHRPVLPLLGICAVLSAQTVPDRLLQGLEWRHIGPFRGGRSVAATGVPGQPETFLFGAVGGGIWKTTNAGVNWDPVFDAQPVASIGALAVAPSDAFVIYAGTGETDIRSDLAIGAGVYKSIDGGRTWAYTGLRETRQIGRILVHPARPETAYVAALGSAYAPNEDRGVFRTTDGGRTWRKVLFKDTSTGAVDLAMDPANPDTLYATLWNAHRPPWSTYGPLEGPGSGLYKSTDGGTTWRQLTGHGLPEPQWGRVGVAAAGGGRVYALIDAGRAGGLFRSDDSGATWTRTSADPRITSRNWYFGGVTVDPHNSDRVYVPNVALYRSGDAGKTFEVLKGAPGGDDYHFLWIDPTSSARMICGSDQGAVISVDGGTSWSPWYNQPTAQMYHVATDNQFPYWVYGSQQDSGTVALPSRTDGRSISEYDRRTVGGAESGYVQPDPRDPNIVYVSNTYGSLMRFDRRTSESQNITPWPVPGFGTEISQRKYRFPWTAPLVFSESEPDALYYGAQMVLKTTDGGLHWAEISGDLTGDERQPGETAQPTGPVTLENARGRGYGVVYSIAPSPLNTKLVWAGSDTGVIHVTRDGGKTWTNVTPPGLSAWSKITHIEASHFEPGVAYAAVDRHRLDDYQPHLFRTADYGKTWRSITTGIADGAFLNAIREDPKRRGLLFAATETGVWVSFSDGERWQPLQLNLPVTSVRDLVIRANDLVIATHGRGFWILDDFTPLRQYNDAVISLGVWLAKPAAAIRLQSAGFLGTPLPPEVPQARNPAMGAVIDYVLQDPSAGEITLEFLDRSGEVIRRFSSRDAAPSRSRAMTVADVWVQEPRRLTAKTGLNRFVWDLRYAAPAAQGGPPGRAAEGPLVLPGSYTVRLTAGGSSLTRVLDVVADPRAAAAPAALQAQFELSMRALRGMQRADELIRSTQSPEVRRRASAARRDLNAALSVAQSADRTPPQAAYALAEGALRELDGIGR